MFEVILENKVGDQLTFGQNSPFTITEIEGLNPPPAIINTSEVSLMDGQKFNSSKLEMRTLNVAFAIEYQAAKNRVEIYKVLKSKQWVKFTYIGQYRQVYIEGYIASIDITFFEMKQIVTCSIMCPSPYFKEAQQMINEMVSVISAFHFPFASTEEPELVFSYLSDNLEITIDNDGDVECGMIMVLYAKQAVSNPKIFNYLTGEYIGLSFSMLVADQITIDTRQGQKTVKLLRNGVTTNIFNYVMQGSTWLQLPAEGGTFVYEVGTGNAQDLKVTFQHNNLYEGV